VVSSLLVPEVACLLRRISWLTEVIWAAQGSVERTD
jgi:hypothetical protein